MDNKENSTKEKALHAFISYVEVVQTVIRDIKDGKIRNFGGPLLGRPSHPKHFLYGLEKLEGSEEFVKLATIFSEVYGGTNLRSAGRLKNYFRRSGSYLDIIAGNIIDSEVRFEELWSAFSERDVKITALRTINNIEFPEEVMDFGKFKIQKFSKAELDELLDQEVCRAFYPYAVVDTGKLCLFWHITEVRSVRKDRENLRVIDMGIAWEDVFKVQRTFPDKTLQLLALFDRGNAAARLSPEMQKTDLGFEGLDLPFIHAVSDDLIDWPMASHDLSKLNLVPFFTPNGEETDEEIPQFSMHFSQSELDQLREIIKVAYDFLENCNLQKCEWEFLEIAIGSLAKAFFSKDGLEQLLWNIIAIEALIGERNQTEQNIRRRLGLIWGGGDMKKIDEIGKDFKELYEFRSSLVHGRNFSIKKDKTLYRYHLRLARDYARKTILWFICYLSHIYRELEKGSVPLNKYPKQKELLALLDYQIHDFEHEGVKVQMMQKDCSKMLLA